LFGRLEKDRVLLNTLTAIIKYSVVVLAFQAFRRVNARLFVVDVWLHGVDPARSLFCLDLSFNIFETAK